MTSETFADSLLDKFKDDLIESDAYFVDAGAFSCSQTAIDFILQFIGEDDLDSSFDKVLFLFEVKEILENRRYEFFKFKE